MRRIIASGLLAFVLASGMVSAQDAPSRPTTRPASPAERILVISVDGLRPDLMLRARTPNIHWLFENGTYTFWAKTVPESITLPSHTSMLTGVSPRKHGIDWNVDLPLSRPVYPKVPTLFALARRAGYSTALVAGKSKFDTLAKPGTLDYTAISERGASDDASVAADAVKIIAESRPQVMFVHFPGADNVGHSKGWGSPDQIKAIEAIDYVIGDVFRALSDARVLDSTIVILTADHGGAGKGHGPEDPRSRSIPWVIHGPGIRRGVDLTTADVEVRTEDTFATSCYLLGIPLPRGIDGKPVLAALQTPPELLSHATSRADDADQR